MLTLGNQDNHTLEDDWTVVTDDGKAAAHTEHTFTLTPQGPWVLTALDGGEAKLSRARRQVRRTGRLKRSRYGEVR